MFYYFDKTTHRCVFTCSMPIEYGDSLRIEAADGFNVYPLEVLVLADGMVSVDEASMESIVLETKRKETIDLIDVELRTLDGFEKYDGVDVSEAREALLLVRHKTVKALTPEEIPTLPKTENGLLVKEEK